MTSAVVTLWYITTANPLAVLAKGPKADRGFGRKMLSMLNPTWPVTLIGQFPLNRSAHASPGEFYIGGYPRLTVVQTVVDDATKLSALPKRLVEAVAAADTYAFAVNPDNGLGGFAHWRGHTLKRSFVATRSRIFEDYGMPEPFESPYWAMESHQILELAFNPIDLVGAAQRGWLGFEVGESGPEINVIGYAIDGRSEPKFTPRTRSPKEVVENAQTELSLDAAHNEYDDYETENIETAGVMDTARAFGRIAAHNLNDYLHTVRGNIDRLKKRLRHTDRSQ